MRIIRMPACPDRYAFQKPLPPVGDRPNPDTAAALDRWHLHLPGEHAFWNWYLLCGCSLADFPGVAPAKKSFPDATHEVFVAAINPEFPVEKILAGGASLLRPFNYVFQVRLPSDELANELLETLAESFVAGSLRAEPQGFAGARERFQAVCGGFMLAKGLTAT